MGSTNESVVQADGAILVSQAVVSGYDFDHKVNTDRNGMTRLPADAEDRAAAFLENDWASASA